MNAKELHDLYNTTGRCTEFCREAVKRRLVPNEQAADIVWHVIDHIHDQFTLTANEATP